MSPGGGFPPSDIVERMVLCYQTTALAYQHLHATNTLLPYVVPELEARGVLESAVRVYLLLNRLSQNNLTDRLLEITQNGRVGQEMQSEFDQIVAELRELVQPCLELGVYWRQESSPI